jgi:L-alanine-DL-glutamate epimerase-like enolase superfamily enzyme
MVFGNSDADAARDCRSAEAVEDDVEIMDDAEQGYDGGTSISIVRAIVSYRPGWARRVMPRQKIEEETTRRSAAKRGCMGPGPNAAVSAARGSAQLLERPCRSLVLTGRPDILDRLFG